MAKPQKTVLNKQLYSSNQQNQVCSSCKCIFAHAISKHQVSISLALRLVCCILGSHGMELLLWWGLKRELDYILLVRTDHQNERSRKKKVFNP